MYVEFGNVGALEGYRDPTSDDPDLVRYRTLDGQRTTRVVFPEEIGLREAFSTAIGALGFHMQADVKPVWIESDSSGLVALLEEHFGLPPSRNVRPKTWGKDTSTAAMSSPVAATAEDA